MKMISNAYEAELRELLKADLQTGRVREYESSTPFFEGLSKAYPLSGSKIDWKCVPASIQCFDEDASQHVGLFVKFVDDIAKKFSLEGEVVYVGDSATDFALGGMLEDIRPALPSIFAIPQHHYLIGPEFSWCLCCTMEGDMAFGRSPAA